MTLRPGTSVSSFFASFPDEEACLVQIFRTRFAQGKCPRCDTVGSWTRIRGRTKWRHSCGRHISPREGTLFYQSNLSLMAWFYALLLFANFPRGPSTGLIRRQLGLGTRSAYRLCLRIRYQFAALARPPRLGGDGKKVYVDELQIKQLHGLEAVSRNAIVVLACACEGLVLSCIIDDRRKLSLCKAMRRFIDPDSIIVTDAFSCYKELAKEYRGHIVVNHTKAFSDFKGTTTNEVETYFATLKRAFRAFQRVQSRNAWAYLAEIEQRYNRRHCPQPLFETLTSNYPMLDREAIAALKQSFDMRTVSEGALT